MAIKISNDVKGATRGDGSARVELPRGMGPALRVEVVAMLRRSVVISMAAGLVLGAGMLTGGGAAAAGPTPAGSWGTAIAVPGIAGLNAGGR
jgi:hypothetical protein